jgi:hypothetical protein
VREAANIPPSRCLVPSISTRVVSGSRPSPIDQSPVVLAVVKGKPSGRLRALDHGSARPFQLLRTGIEKRDERVEFGGPGHHVLVVGRPAPPMPPVAASTAPSYFADPEFAALFVLPPECREFVRLRFEDELSQDQVAQSLACSRRRVRTLENRVQKGLRRHLKKRGLLSG